MVRKYTANLDGEDLHVLRRHYTNEAESFAALRGKMDSNILKTYQERMARKAMHFTKLIEETENENEAAHTN